MALLSAALTPWGQMPPPPPRDGGWLLRLELTWGDLSPVTIPSPSSNPSLSLVALTLANGGLDGPSHP